MHESHYTMTTQKWGGALREMTGRLQETTGRWVGSKEQQTRGLQRQVLGRADQRNGDARLSRR
jgi:uncharacterized protein YjbJ (UPF0337 family)